MFDFKATPVKTRYIIEYCYEGSDHIWSQNFTSNSSAYAWLELYKPFLKSWELKEL